MSNISVFNFNQSQVRIQILNDTPLFCLKDVASVLHISNSKSSRFNLDEKGVHKMYPLTDGGNQELTFINEPNLYRVIFRSNKTEAIEFQNWVFNEVLPTIRKTGSYSKPQPTLPHFKDEITVNRTNLICLVSHMLWLNRFYREKAL